MAVKFLQPAACLIFAACLIPCARSEAQQPADADLAAGLDLVSHLKPASPQDPFVNQAVFSALGFDRAEKLLFAVEVHGSSPAATSDDWAAMHRALDGLIELKSEQAEFLRASIYATLQESAYRRNEVDYLSALAAARQALDLQQRSGELASVWIPWKSIGEDLIHLGRIDDGAVALLQARSLLPDPLTPFAADLWSEIVSVESARGNSAAAHRESAAFLNAASPLVSADFRAYALLAAANLAIDDQRYEDAIARTHQALHAIKESPNATLLGYQAINTLLTLGMEATQSMPYEQAIALCQRLEKDFPGLPVSLSGFAPEILNHRRRLAGQFDLVLREDSARLDRARAANDVSAQIGALLSIAVDFSYLRDVSQQVAAMEQAAEIIHSAAGDSVSPLLRFRALNLLAAAKLASGDLRGARAAYSEVLTGIEAISAAKERLQLGTLYAEAQLGKALVTERDGNLGAARDILRQSLAPAPGSPGKFTRSSVLLQSARLERTANQQPEEVVRLYLDAIAALRQEKDLNSEVAARLQLTEYLATSKPLAYGALAREQLALARAASSSLALADSTWRIEYLAGVLHQRDGERAAAIRCYYNALTALDRIRAGLPQEEERRSFIDSASTQELYRRLAGLLTDAGDRNGAWEILERNKARSFLDALHGRRFVPSPSSSGASAAAELNGLEQQIIAARILLSPESESLLRGSGNSPEAVSGKLASLEARFALVRQREAVAASRVTQPLALLPISLAATQASLPPHTALIEYAILDHELAAFVLTRNSATELHWPVDTLALPAKIRWLRAQMASAKPPPELSAQLAAASQVLLAPVLPAVPPQTTELILVPTEYLSSIPFEALPLPAGFSNLPSLLIDRFAIAYLPSASTLQFLCFGPPAASPDLFLGALGNVSVEGWPALPGTLQETQKIQALYPRASRITGAAFTHDVSIAALLRYSEVHFATHGIFDSQSPLFSALLTAPAPGQESRLSLYEVMDLRVKSRLVILSACETDRGHLSGGDEIVGLTRIFLQAGAESVVSSLWKVDDQATTLLMESLHTHLRLGESTPQALRHAQLETRRKFPQPFYWAAFIETGVR
jgi:CHAT domain-containing protein